jgi:hypothetical protein
MGLTPGQRHLQTGQTLSIAERRRLVAANLLGGATYAELATLLNVSKATIASDYKAILKEWQDHYKKLFNQYVHVQLRRYDMLLNAVWDDARSDKIAKRERNEAMDRALAIMDRMNKLMGLAWTEDEVKTESRVIQIVEVHRAPPAPLLASVLTDT